MPSDFSSDWSSDFGPIGPAAQNWPTGITQYVNTNGYVEAPERNIAEFQPEVGPPKRRRRTAVATTLYECTTTLSSSDCDILMTFYRDTLLDGVLTFNRFLPRDPTGTQGWFEFMFTSPPQCRAIDALWFDVSFGLRKMP